MKRWQSTNRGFSIAVLAILAGTLLTGCSFYEVKNLTGAPVRVILDFGDEREARLVGPGDSWVTWSTSDTAYGATVKEGKAYQDKFDSMNGEFESIKSNSGLTEAEREAQIKDFMLKAVEQFQQVQTIGQCASFTCLFCNATITIDESLVTCVTDDTFAELLKSAPD